MTVFTVVTVIFSPLSFITALFAVNITELPHDSAGNQQMSLSFVLKYVLGPGLGFAGVCILIAFFGTLVRTFHRVKRKRHDLEMAYHNEKLKAF